MLSKIIKIAGKSNFDQLSWAEFGSMIDACLDGDNDSFDCIALNEFVRQRVVSPQLRDLQRDLNANWLLDGEHGKIPPLNESYLRGLSAKLKAGEYP